MRADIAQTWGVAPNATVCVAVGDHQASLIGSGCDQSGHVHVNLGTGGQVSMIVPEFAPADAQSGLETRPFVDGCFIVTGASLCGGEAFALLQRFFSDAMVRLGVPAVARPAVDAIYTALVAAAGEVDDGEFRATPQFDGARHDPSATASFTGLTRANFTAAHLTRATLRGIADELGAFYDAMRARHGAGIALSGSGNALRLNPLLATFVAERLGLSLAVPAWEEEAAVGAAILAGTGTASIGAGAGRG
jgi:sedoheptulokinase